MDLFQTPGITITTQSDPLGPEVPPTSRRTGSALRSACSLFIKPSQGAVKLGDYPLNPPSTSLRCVCFPLELCCVFNPDWSFSWFHFRAQQSSLAPQRAMVHRGECVFVSSGRIAPRGSIFISEIWFRSPEFPSVGYPTVRFLRSSSAANRSKLLLQPTTPHVVMTVLVFLNQLLNQ